MNTMLKNIMTFSLAKERPYANVEKEEMSERGRVYDLVIPILFLIVCAVIALIYTGGFFDKSGETYLNFVDAFAGADAATGLALGGVVALFGIIIYYLCRRVLKLKAVTEIFPKGVTAMASPILILTFAWTLKAMTDALGSTDAVTAFMEGPAGSLKAVLPFASFIVPGLIAFAGRNFLGNIRNHGSNRLLSICWHRRKASCLWYRSNSRRRRIRKTTAHQSLTRQSWLLLVRKKATSSMSEHSFRTHLRPAIFSAVMFLLAGFIPNAIIMLPIALVGFIAVLFVIRQFFGKRVVEFEGEKKAE
jgi:hypothetical protein